jgi:hypothetical protein
MSRWWRAYDEAVDDPKLCLLTDKQHRAWFNLCCITSQNGGTLPSLAAIAFKLRVKPDAAKHIVAELAALGLIDFDVNGDAAPHNWGGRQFQSDVSTDRVKRFRERQGNVSSAVSETPPYTEAETEQKSSLRSDCARSRKTRLPDDWRLDEIGRAYARQNGWDEQKIDAEETRFRDHAKANGRKQIDWPAAWRNWVTSPFQETRNGKRAGNSTGAGRRGGDAVLAGMGNIADRLAGNREDAGGTGESLPFDRPSRVER